MKHNFSILKIKNTSKIGTSNSDWINSIGVKESWDILLDMVLKNIHNAKIYNILLKKVKEFRRDINEEGTKR